MYIIKYFIVLRESLDQMHKFTQVPINMRVDKKNLETN